MRKFTQIFTLISCLVILGFFHVASADTTSGAYDLGYAVACPGGTTYDAGDNACHSPINCAVSGWSAYGGWSYNNGTACGTTGTRTHTRTRTIDTYPAYGGAGCPALSEDASEAYDTGSCPVNGVCSATHYSCGAGTSVSNGSNGSSWTWGCNGLYGGSNASCSEGIPVINTLTVPDVAYGVNPPITFTTSNVFYCHVRHDWVQITENYMTGGTFYPGAQTSPGTHQAEIYCYNSNWAPSGWSTVNYTVGPAPVNGGWSGWSAQDNSCTTSPSTRTQTRSCNNPTPAYGGAACSGSSTQDYAVAGCPVNGGWSGWSAQDNSCTTSPSTRTQTRSCNNPTPAYGGAACSGSSTQDYAVAGCPVSGVCSSAHYSCGVGASTSNAQNATTWTWGCAGIYGGASPSCSEGIATVTSISAPNISYGASSAVTFTSVNAYYCYVYHDWTYYTEGYFTGGTIGLPAQNSPGGHEAEIYCYNSNWAGSLAWGIAPYTVYTPSGSLSSSSSSCTVAQNANTCAVNLTWSTANSVYTSAITKTGSASPIVNANSGSQAFTVPYGGTTFFLYNSGYLLGQTSVSTSCVAGTTWNGSICVAPTGTLSSSVNSCLIGLRGNSCGIDYSWSVSYPIGGTTVVDQSNTQVGSGNPGADTFTIPYGASSKTFYLKNNGNTLDTKTASASCASPYAWNGSTCVPASTSTLSANPTKVPYNTASTLSWSSTDASSCTLTGGSVNTSGTSGSISTGNITSQKTYTLNCTGWAGNSSASVTVYVIPSITFTSNPKLMISRRPAKLIWSTVNASSCTGTNFSTGVGSPISGQAIVTPTVTTNYTITCNGFGGATNSATLRANTTKIKFREL
jgi:hypothetical protein